MARAKRRQTSGESFNFFRLQKTPKVDFSENEYYEPTFDFYDKRLLERVIEDDPYVHEFFTLLALCHTVMSEEKDGKGLCKVKQIPKIQNKTG